MFQNNYKRAIDEIKPSAEAVTKTLEAMQSAEKTERKMPKKVLRILIASCLSVAVITASLFAILNHSGIFDRSKRTEFDGIRQAQSYNDIKSVVDEYYGLDLGGLTYGNAEDAVVTDRVVAENEMAPGSVDNKEAITGENADYSDTNNQIQGVQEADIVKTDGRYIYYLSAIDKTLYIASAEDGSMEKAASVSIDADYVHEMILVGDTLCIIAGGTSVDKNTICLYYDISDKSTPTLNHVLTQDGRYLSSRAIGNDIFVITSFYEVKNGVLKKNTEIPELNGEQLDADEIWIPEKITTPEYTIVTKYDIKEDKDDFSSAVSVIGASDTMFSGEKNLYLTTSQSGIETAIDNGTKSPSVKTNIFRICLTEDELTISGAGFVPGYVLNQFSMDEHDGKLRVATHIQLCNVSADGKSVSYSGERVNRVYCLGDDMEIVGVSGDMGKNESIKSVRFMGDIAYVVTFRQTDPLYAVDMSDPTEPKILSELKIDGFSSYMQQFTDNLLLGIGFDADPNTGIQSGLKLTMFDISDKADINDISSYVLSWSDGFYSASSATYNHKAVLLNGSKNIIGIPLYMEGYELKAENGSATNDFSAKVCYVFLEFDGTDIVEKKRIEIVNGEDAFKLSNDTVRGLYIGDCSYIVSDFGIICLSLDALEIVSELKFK